MYFLDPQSGRRRRAVARDKLKSRLNRRMREQRQHSAFEEGRQRGELLHSAGAGGFHQQHDNRSVADHLHAVLQRSEVWTGDVTVEVIDDVVRVRGQVRTEDERSRVLAAVGAESGDRQVESLLHLPNEPAPNKAASRRPRSA
jgi:hypothetical protein